MILQLLPERTDSAAGNMAADFLLLHRYPADGHIRWRHYGWHRPAVTFGFAQRIGWVRQQLPALDPPAADATGPLVELCRRPTGGGIVDHRDDWTYALVLPRQHPVADGRLLEAYRIVHQALAEALDTCGCPAVLSEGATEPDADDAGGGVCFQRPERFDVVRADGPTKLAGAAIKRGKRGLLLQGSIRRIAAGALNWEDLAAQFSSRLAAALGATAEPAGWPEFDEGEVEALTEQYASPEWTEQR